MMRFLLKITLGLFGLISLMMGLLFVSGQRSTPDDPWLVVVNPDLGGSATRVSQSGKVAPLETSNGQPLQGVVLEVKDGWVWFHDRWYTSSDIYRVRLDGTLMERVTRLWFSKGFVEFSGNGQWLLFAAGEYVRDIYRIRVNGSWPHRLVDLPGADWVVGFTADGVWLLFLNGDYNRDLWRVNTNTGEMQQLTHDVHVESAELSPDRQWVYFQFENPDRANDLARLRVDGTGFQQLTFTGTVHFWGLPHVWLSIFTHIKESNPSLVSPDGKWLLFRTMTPISYESQYLVMRADGQMLHQLPIEGRIVGWSTDSEWIYYEYIPNLRPTDGLDWRARVFYRMRRDGSGQEVLEPEPFSFGGRLSDDGKWIFVGVPDVVRACLCFSEYYAIATDGSGKWLVAQNVVDVLEIRLSPDGRWYYFLTNADYTYADLYRIRVGTNNPPEKLARFLLNVNHDITMLGWFESPHKHWSPLLIFGVSVSTIGAAGLMVWKARGRPQLV